ncbi:hypothetical protein CSB09_02000 [Candidatus Gracilibacteria bacterium]|nr:MAG: hypothetical protein CSB09_02000 [Candidatus Gracilibacteria bacterium]
MKLISLKIDGFKNLKTKIDFTKSEGISVFVGNNGSGKSNVLEAISAIFYGLYDETNERRCNFTYSLEYEINSKNIIIQQLFFRGKEDAIGKLPPEILEDIPDVKEELKMVSCCIDGELVGGTLDKKYLPSQIIALYSGEETRLYEDYYLYEYDNFIKSIITSKKGVSENINMSFIGKDFWNIALLTMFASDFSLSEIIGDYKIDKLLFKFNEKNLKIFNEKNPNEVTRFVLGLSEIENINFEKFKESFFQTHKELFNLLSVAYLPKEESYNLIEEFDLELTNGENTFWASCLSEGQKKQILIYFVTAILANKDSIILLDEPDSYIHVGNKQRLKKIFTNFLDITKEGEFIMTTHSPTLMNNFEEKHLFYLENGKLDKNNKRNILDNITDGEMSMTDMEIFLNSKNKYLLVTEGKTDKKHIEIAIDKLGIENNFDIYPADGCDKLKQFLVGLPTDILSNKIIIGIFDYDQEGLKSLKKCGDVIQENKLYKIPAQKNRYGISLPCIDRDFERFKNQPIEFMYSKDILDSNNMLIKQDIRTINNNLESAEQLNLKDHEKLDKLCFFNVNDTNKNNFAESCKELPKEEFERFRALFDKILEIKSEN